MGCSGTRFFKEEGRWVAVVRGSLKRKEDGLQWYEEQPGEVESISSAGALVVRTQV